MSLQELSLRTKIPVPRLQQIEQGNFAALPPRIYARGMLRAVAREVGCDPERIVASLPQDGGDERAGIAASAVPTHSATRTDSVTRVHAAEIDAMDVRRRRAQWGALVALLLLSGALYASLTDHSFRASSVSQVMDEDVVGVGVSPAALRADAAADAPAPVMISGTATAPLATNEQADDIRVQIRADNVCWVSGTADGRRVIYRLLNAGDDAEIRAAADLVLRVGDPTALRLTINGGAGRLLGRAGEPVTVHVTRENYRDFLQSGTGPAVTLSATAVTP
jgi:cytoskeleton protein RodZ